MGDDKDIEVEVARVDAEELADVIEDHIADKLPAGYERDVELEAEIEKILDDEPSARVKIRLSVAVNGYKRGDVLVVERSHPFFGGLIEQGIAEVID